VFLRPWTQAPEVEYALCRCYNRWLADIWKQAPDRLRWAVMPHLLTPDRVRAELEFGKENGACAVYLHGIEHDSALYSERFFPLYRMAEELDMPVCFHAGNNSFLLEGMYREDSGFAKAKLPLVATFHQLLLKGVPAKFPKLRWGFVEVSAQWVPYVLIDLEDRYRRNGWTWYENPLKDNNMYVACENTDDLTYVLSHAGEDNLVIGTDYGHHDPSSEVNAMRLLREDKRLAPGVAKKILEINPKRLYGLN
jgi:predicted TIM-barrel fold metal-dependent hydrolase